MKPKLLLAGKNYGEAYSAAVDACGGEAVFVYCPDADPSGYDGLILCGGSDISPAFYGQELNGAKNMDECRDAAEKAAFEAFFMAGKPILGICRGHQLLNVLLGGELCQDLPNTAFHSGNPIFSRTHTVHTEKDSFLYPLYGEAFAVNSAHHQSVTKPGKGMRVIQRAEDGCVEATEHESHPILSVQWHPEQMCLAAAREDTVDGLALFEHFIRLCKK